MTTHRYLAAGAALFVTFAATGALAMAGDYMCETFSPAKNARPVTHCVTWNRQDAARLRAAPCDPKMMSDAAMREKCADMMAHPERYAPAAG